MKVAPNRYRNAYWRAKAPRNRYKGLIKPLLGLFYPWTEIALDLCLAP